MSPGRPTARAPFNGDPNLRLLVTVLPARALRRDRLGAILSFSDREPCDVGAERRRTLLCRHRGQNVGDRQVRLRTINSARTPVVTWSSNTAHTGNSPAMANNFWSC